MNQAPELSAIVVAFDSGPDLATCLDSVRREARRERITAELLVIDNASTDGAVDQLDADGLTVIRNATNRGFGAAVNQGFRQATGERVLVINPDARLQAGSLRKLMDALDEPGVALAAPTLQHLDGSRQESPRRFYDLAAVAAQRTPWGAMGAGRAARARHVMDDLDRSTPSDVDWVTGAAMLLDRDAIGAVGPFDERFFLYFEDVDLCRRLAAMDRRVRYVPDAVVAHRHRRGSRAHRLTNPLLWHHVRSGLLYASRWSAAWWHARWWRAAVVRVGRASGRASLLAAVALLGGLAGIAVPPGLLLLLAVLGLVCVPSRRGPPVGEAPRPSVARTALGLVVAGLASLGVASVIGVGIPFPAVLAWALVATVALELGGLLTRGTVRLGRRHGFFHRAVLIAGPAGPAKTVAEALRERPEEGLGVLGWVPLDPLATDGPTPRVRSWESVATAAEDLRADAVLLTGSPDELARMAGGVVALRRAGVDAAFVLSGSTELLQADAPPTLAGLPVLPLGAGPDARALEGIRGSAERFVAALLLVLLAVPMAPLLALVGAAFRGSPLIRTPRVGRDGVSFGMWRLRSGPAGDVDGGWLGGLLRRLHLDEIPQLLNVLAGQMSLVGPRPVTANVFAGLAPWERARCAVRPGITGMWQLDRLRRWRLEQMITSDLLYLLRWSPGLDLRILAGTLLGRRR